jgi:hypothetical protein
MADSSRSLAVVRYVLSFAGWGWSARFLGVMFASSALDLLGIAVIFPYIRIVTEPEMLSYLATKFPAEFGRAI